MEEMTNEKRNDDPSKALRCVGEADRENQELENVSEYELTVTEDALMRLHGLSLALPIPCDLCPIGTVFDDLDEFDAHMGGHAEAKMFACQLCSNTYKSWSNLVAHRKMFHCGEVLCCVKCGTRRSHARLEGAVHYPIGGKPHGCEECEIGLDSISEVHRHYLFHKAPPGVTKSQSGYKVGNMYKKKSTSDVRKTTGEQNRSRSTAQSVGHGRIECVSQNVVQMVRVNEGKMRPLEPKGGFEAIPGYLENENIKPVKVPVQQKTPPKDHSHFCPHCCFSCVTLDEYRRHLTLSLRSHGCGTCCKGQYKRLSMTDHEYCQSQPLQYNCIPCSANLESEEAFTMHLKDFHNGDTLPCCLCGGKYSWTTFIEHTKACQHKRIEWEMKHELKLRTCQPCGKVFHTIGALRRHVKRHDGSIKRLHDCVTCGRSFQHGGAYAKHLSANPTHGPAEMRAKVPGTRANFVCEYCGRTYAKREGLKVHLMRHSGVKPFACTNCPKAFISRTALAVHVRLHTGERPFMCEVCGKNFTGPTSLYVHQRVHKQRMSAGEDSRGSRVAPTKYTCPVCGKVLSTKLIFEGHVRQHTGERPFTCAVCGKGFTTSKILKVHVKRHEKKDPPSKVWVQSLLKGSEEGVEEINGDFDSNSSACIFLCPRCGLGLVSPEELEDHMGRGDCPGGGLDMFVLPMNSNAECIETGSMVELLANASSVETVTC